ncbi:receptor-like kinase [Trifolium pratense]|uniref:Receptor-like kinase n=1 Tax=Trifolium pratense TaxID=57577 RepID=A0A2K3MCP9_TRIPR|nr:receptor-like kinase [Trifolium pratense]
MDIESLWFRVLAARYGMEGGRVKEGGWRWSAWWREIVRIRECADGVRWFRESVSKKVGDGSDTLFWTDSWLGDSALCVRFGRLFELTENKSATVAEMSLLGWGVGGQEWAWRRRLWVWEEEMLGECQTLLLTISLQTRTLHR